MISSFKGEYEFLSNFYPLRIVYNGIAYASVEAAFQAQKTLNKEERLKFTYLTPSEAKKAGRRVTLRPDWEYVKLMIMEDLIRIKFSNSILREKLLMTEDSELIEGNYWNDYYWGVCNGRGLNYLGIILMNIREEIQNEG